MKTTNKNLMSLTATGLSLFLMLSLTSCTDKEAANDDNEMGSTEMAEDTVTLTSNNHFAEWDTNKDGYLDEEEDINGPFATWDANGDGQLDEDELNASFPNKGYEGRGWADWDINRDGFLNIDEYRKGDGRSSWHQMWDKDGDNRLSPQEFEEGLQESRK